MSKLLDLMDKIRNGAPAPMGFGAARAEKLPGMALVGLISGDHAGKTGAVSDPAPDAVLLSGLAGAQQAKEVGDSIESIPWGALVSSLTGEEAEAYRESGGDMLAFPLEGTSAAALTSEEIAHILCLNTNIEEQELRAISSLPVDGFLLSMTGVSGPWTLRDLATVGNISRRVDKYILVEISSSPEKSDLEALRDIGVHGLVADVGALGAEALSGLKQALLDMPKAQPSRRGRNMAVLPGSVYGTPREPEPEEEDDDDDE